MDRHSGQKWMLAILLLMVMLGISSRPRAWAQEPCDKKCREAPMEANNTLPGEILCIQYKYNDCKACGQSCLTLRPPGVGTCGKNGVNDQYDRVIPFSNCALLCPLPPGKWAEAWWLQEPTQEWIDLDRKDQKCQNVEP